MHGENLKPIVIFRNCCANSPQNYTLNYSSSRFRSSKVVKYMNKVILASTEKV
jgi:hypothetical protein